ncbi:MULTISPECIES: hypothetical protein [Mycobacterium]|uniref:Uncharacterized protein n=1 Tax=Mycobacterium kiyosense TaxID=2871094 RepID=A0A9P3UUY6_9MYCO|nr:MULTISPECIES: hypothetical protein [Mycobacterium]BDE14040.1 hypothetical protein MKCMC460_29000 [Mycobacterium sp. 20KCMC460]GLB81204.1 hypothetical protein SRL2020028_04600 [Mycobacterium kiyosense]GLB88234.1 hypothetical protein SRL2020130_10510 [Mycobacterium kiyosense]GLB94540.1 hypothetical protein SRL2020226_13160 [Mycobacterium kiyosense]GLB99922.1 hypothetical protein SRL2020400_05140 [Mycobacterium kiyosense]
MDASQAIAAVTEHIRRVGLDYPTAGLAADRFEAGWSVYAPVEVDASDPIAFLGMPVGRAVFVVGDCGRIEQVSSSTPPQAARRGCAEQERVLAQRRVDGDDLMGQLADAFGAVSGRQPSAAGLTLVDDCTPADAAAASRDKQIDAQAATLLDPIVQELAVLGPPGWQAFTAVFALTVVAGTAACWFTAAEGATTPVAVPEPVLRRVRDYRHLSAQMSAGPWWRLIMTVTHQGQLRASYDYGDQPLPEDQLQPAENYRADIQTYPRPSLPVWLAGYLAGPAAQGRTPAQAAAAVLADAAAGRGPTETDDIEPLPDTWTRWAVLSAVYAGARSQWGPRIAAAMAWYESDAHSGSTLYVLPGERAVLSGGRWNSPLLATAYQQQQPLPELYAGAPEWVTDSVLNTRNQNGLLSLCYWWTAGRWWRARTDTFDELDEPLPAIWTPEETVTAMVGVTGPEVEDACRTLLWAAGERSASRELLLAVFAGYGDCDIDAAYHQLNLAGLTR